MDLPNYDAWKLASPEDYNRVYCDECRQEDIHCCCEEDPDAWYDSRVDREDDDC